MGSPRVWAGCSRAKVKIRVSEEMTRLEWRIAFDQMRGWRKVGRGVLGKGEGCREPSERESLEAASRVPRWWDGIMALAVSESGA